MPGCVDDPSTAIAHGLTLFLAIETRIFQREGAKESAGDGLSLGRLVVIHVVIGEMSANLRAFALKNRFDCRA
jgi:hypothetical protein